MQRRILCHAEQQNTPMGLAVEQRSYQSQTGHCRGRKTSWRISWKATAPVTVLTAEGPVVCLVPYYSSQILTGQQIVVFSMHPLLQQTPCCKTVSSSSSYPCCCPLPNASENQVTYFNMANVTKL